MEFEHVKPMDIEKRSMEIIGQELAEMGISLPANKAHIIKRVIHTSADFDYAQTLTFSEDALERATDALKPGASIITDTKMAWSGINKRRWRIWAAYKVLKQSKKGRKVMEEQCKTDFRPVHNSKKHERRSDRRSEYRCNH